MLTPLLRFKRCQPKSTGTETTQGSSQLRMKLDTSLRDAEKRGLLVSSSLKPGPWFDCFTPAPGPQQNQPPEPGPPQRLHTYRRHDP